ncbi:rod-binding protein [Roseicyclus sp.]|uniref:rod-binding protein n=1 Tax=Roseicyclus sp. TaxID=1914329 RepID=UPI003FA17987
MQIEPIAPPSSGPPARDHAHLRRVSQELEAAFLAEMLKHAGIGTGRNGLGGGGAGEDQFASLLRTEHAALLTERGGIGLAESIFRALLAREPTPAETPR